MAISKKLIIIGLAFAFVLLIASEVSARELAQENEEVKMDNSKEDGYHGGYGHEGGGYRGGNGGGNYRGGNGGGNYRGGNGGGNYRGGNGGGNYRGGNGGGYRGGNGRGGYHKRPGHGRYPPNAAGETQVGN